MSRKIGLLLTMIFIVLLIFYFGYDAYIHENSSQEFFDGYLGNPQRYLFVFSLVVVPILFFQHTPVFTAIYAIRLKNRLLEYIFKEIMKVSFFTTFFIYINLFVNSLVWGIGWRGVNHLNLCMRLFSFVLTCCILYYVIYAITKKHFVSIVTVIISNFVYIAIIINIQFFLFTNELTSLTMNMLFTAYLFIICVSGIFYLLTRIKRKECYL